MAKRYTRINWQNKPSVSTPMSASNLNIMDKGINDIDDAVENLYTTKLDANKIVNNQSTTSEEFGLSAVQANPSVDGTLAYYIFSKKSIYTASNTKINVSFPSTYSGSICGISLSGSGLNGTTYVAEIGIHNGQTVCTSLGSATVTASISNNMVTITAGTYFGGCLEFRVNGSLVMPNITYSS